MSPLSGLFTYTLRLWRANLLSLVTASLLGTAVSLVVAGLLEGPHSAHAFSGSSLIGIDVYIDPTGRHLHLDVAVLLTDLVSVAVAAWASCTMVALLMRHVRLGVRTSLRDLGCGLPFWGWVGVVGLLYNLIDRLSGAAGAVWTVLAVPGAFLRFLVGLAFYTVFLLYVQEIVDEGHDAFGALRASWRLVRGVGFWRVLGNNLLLVVCLMPALVLTALLAVHFGTHSAARTILLDVALSVVILPVTVAFTTAMYLLARGDRTRIVAILGPAGRNATATAQPSTPVSPSAGS